MRITLSLLVAIAAAVPCAADPSPQIRGTSITETRIIQDLLRRSVTARTLAAEIESSDLIVYVQLSGDQPQGRAATRFAAASGPYRYVRVVIGSRTHPSDRAALLAHELQHALEIARAQEVRDENGLRRLYARIGEDPHAQFAFETTAAREVGSRVLRELIGPSTALTPARLPE